MLLHVELEEGILPWHSLKYAHRPGVASTVLGDSPPSSSQWQALTVDWMIESSSLYAHWHMAVRK